MNLKLNINQNGGLEIITEDEPLYMLTGFENSALAEKRLSELKKCYPNPYYDIRTYNNTSKFGIVLPYSAIPYLKDEEKSMVNIFVKFDIMPTQSLNSLSLYRFIEIEYVEDFFSNGSLMLSTFDHCKKLDNLDRRDEKEGNLISVAFGSGLTLMMKTEYGQNSLVLCTSTSSNNVLPSKTYEACIVIRDVINFIYALTKRLLKEGYKVHKVICGQCNYNDNSITTNCNLDTIKADTENNDMQLKNIIQTIESINRNEGYLTKPKNKEFEKEFRIIWLLENPLSSDKIIIEAPELIPFCEKKIYQS